MVDAKPGLPTVQEETSLPAPFLEFPVKTKIPICRIPDYGKVTRSTLYSELMSPSGDRLETEERPCWIRTSFLQAFHIGLRVWLSAYNGCAKLSSPSHHREPVPPWLPVSGRDSLNNGRIGFFHLVGGEGLPDRLSNLSIAGKEKNSGSRSVESVEEVPRSSLAEKGLLFQVIGQIEERETSIVLGVRMRKHSRRFFHRYQTAGIGPENTTIRMKRKIHAFSNKSE